MAIQKITTSIDYTSRDFFSLREDLITRIKSRVNAQGKVWTASDPADFGVAIVEAFAHVGDLTNYYIDRIANEAYLSTATQRQSLLNIASLYGYRVSGYRQALVDVTLTNVTGGSIVIPEGTLLSASITITTNGSPTTYREYFTLTSDVEISSGGSGTGVLVHGKNVTADAVNASDGSDVYDIPGERLGYSTGLPNQSYTLKNNQVADGTVSVFVRNGDAFVQWQEVTNLSEHGPQDTVYALSYSGNNYVTINFGNGVSGAVPVYGDDIKAQYYTGGGLIGNIEANTNFSIESVPLSSGVLKTAIVSTVISNDFAGYGGEDPESNESIRANAPTALRVSQRAVTLDDFKNLALTMPDVGKAVAYASAPTSVALYIGPTVSDISSDYYPGYNSTNTTTTTLWNSLKTSVVSEFSTKTQIGTTVTVLPPIYVPADVVVEYVAEEGYSDSQLSSSINSGIVYGYGYNYLDFKQSIRPEKLEQSLSAINGVDSVRIVKLFRTGGSSARTTLIPAQGEYFVFKDANTKIYPIASLSALAVTIANGTMPTFNALTKTYAFTSTSASMTFTPTSVNSVTTIAYVFTPGGGTGLSGTPGASTAITSGAASATLTLATGINIIAVTVTSSDGLNTNIYSIKVTK
jgi:hypothetical protein